MTHGTRNLAYPIKDQKHSKVQELIFLIKANGILILK